MTRTVRYARSATAAKKKRSATDAKKKRSATDAKKKRVDSTLFAGERDHLEVPLPAAVTPAASSESHNLATASKPASVLLQVSR